MRTNDILRRLYSLYPSIGAWAAEGQPGGVWTNAQRAKLEVAHYVGPDAHDEILDCYEIRNPADIEFVHGEDALRAISLIIEAVYNRQPLERGLFPKEQT